MGTEEKMTLPPITFPPGARVQLNLAVVLSHPESVTGTVLEEAWDTKGGCLVRHDEHSVQYSTVFGWSWNELLDIRLEPVPVHPPFPTLHPPEVPR